MTWILVVEDEPDIRQALAEELSDEGYQVDVAVDGHDALDKLSDTHPDLIISDIAMPRMDGLELLQRVRADHPGLDAVPFVLLTAFGYPEQEFAGRTNGADLLLTKPIDFDELFASVEMQLRKAGQRSSVRPARLN